MILIICFSKILDTATSFLFWAMLKSSTLNKGNQRISFISFCIFDSLKRLRMVREILEQNFYIVQILV